MSVRAIQARVECDRQTLEHLWRTHRVFNERLPAILSVLFKMRRGECGETEEERGLYRTIARFILANTQNAEYLLNAVSIEGWKPGAAKKQKAKVSLPDGTEATLSGETWADEAARLSAEGKLLYDKKQALFDLPPTLRQMVCRDAAAYISGHEELVRIWEMEHAQWLKDKAHWEADAEHGPYLALRPRFETFEQEAGGPAGKRRGRWHLYLQWLKDNPDLAAWRGGKPEIVELTPAAQRRVTRAKPWKQRSVEAEEFFKANPELSALDRLHGDYEREFIRRRKTKSNPDDGFKHRPTFTLPSATRHPRWFVFNAPQTSPQGYGNLVLPARPGAEGSVELLAITGDQQEGKYPSDRIKLRFRGDPRLADFRPVVVSAVYGKGKRKGEGKDQPAFEFFDRHLKRARPATIKGIKLIFRWNPDHSPRAAYLYFTCSVEDVPLTEGARAIQRTETGEVTKKGKKRKSKKLPEGLIACAVDLGLRHLGFATLARYADRKAQVLRSRNIWLEREERGSRHPGRRAAGADLAHIKRHQRKLRDLRRQRGKPVGGEKSHVELQQHIDHMGEDRFKQAARAIINFALNLAGDRDRKTGEIHPRADVLILENLAGLIPDAEKERGINRALANWNRGQLVKRVREMAQDHGLKVFKISPVGTSQVCSRCGALGRRYSIVRNEHTKRPEIKFGWVEKLFACPCGYRANADHNASVNLHRRFLLEDVAVKSYLNWWNIGKSKEAKKEKEAEIGKIENSLRGSLVAVHGLAEPTPF